MVCMQQVKKQNTHSFKTDSPHNFSESSESEIKLVSSRYCNLSQDMDFDGDFDRLQLQHLAGGNIVQYPPLYEPRGEFLFIISDCFIQIYSTVTGEITRQLTGATSKIISMELELKHEEVLVACTTAGEILRWNWKTSSNVTSTVPMHIRDAQVLTFNLINFYGDSNTACAFVTAKISRLPIQWFMVDTTRGTRLHVQSSLRLTHAKPLVAVDTKNFNNIVIAQGFYVYFLDYETLYCTRFVNANQTPITVVRLHPAEEIAATGDERGRILLWRGFKDKPNVCTSLYHWHHTAVTSIAFSASGSSFYSSGLESVLVKWNVANPRMHSFVPRMSGIILHIAVSGAGNSQVAVCTADNGVQIIDGQSRVKCTLQEFTYIIDDKTGKSKFPVGLRLDPRTNTLVLNGRMGHLQFYSVYTKSLLYNMDIVAQNTHSVETGKILYNIRVSKAAFNIDWMATGEVYNDEEHLPELRLKFWKYQKETQSYALNTNIELPHEGGFRAIEFSNEYQVDNLLCATVGDDNIIKIWSLDETDNIYKKGKVWYCIGQTSYKSLPIQSISFSQDGSLLAAGFGNTLCIYTADTLKLKAALSGSPGIDGCIPKAQIRIPKQTEKGPNNGGKQESDEHLEKIMKLFTNLLDNKDEAIIKELRKSLDSSSKQNEKEKKKRKDVLKPLQELDDKMKEQIYNKIMKTNELNLFQKVLIFQKLKISCQVHPQWQQTVAKYLRDTVDEASQRERYARLDEQLNRVNMRDRFKAKYRLHRYATRKRIYDDEISRHLVPILSVMNLNEISKQPQSLTNGKHCNTPKRAKVGDTDAGHTIPTSSNSTRKLLLPAIYSADISHVQFAAGEYAHLVIVCYKNRVLIWNLLTLRLQSVLKLTVEHLTLDPLTNLIAAFTKYNELHIFQPNVPLPIYQRRNLPKIHAAIWLARGRPKQRSINLDWQAQSKLYFLTENQEIMYLGSPEDPSCDAPPPIALKRDSNISDIHYSTFGTFAAKQINETQTKTRQNGPIVFGRSKKSAIKSLIEMSTHTMPPLSLLCCEFMKSLVRPETGVRADCTTKKVNHSSSQPNNAVDGDDVIMNGHHTKKHKKRSDDDDDEPDDDDDSDDDENKVTAGAAASASASAATSQPQYQTNKLRKELLTKEQEISRKERVKLENLQSEAQITEAHLRRLAEQTFDLEI